MIVLLLELDQLRQSLNNWINSISYEIYQPIFNIWSRPYFTIISKFTEYRFCILKGSSGILSELLPCKKALHIQLSPTPIKSKGC